MIHNSNGPAGVRGQGWSTTSSVLIFFLFLQSLQLPLKDYLERGRQHQSLDCEPYRPVAWRSVYLISIVTV